MAADQWRLQRRSSPLLQHLWEYAQHEQRKATAGSQSPSLRTSLSQASSASLHPPSLSLSPPPAAEEIDSSEDVGYVGLPHRSFDAAPLMASADPSAVSHYTQFTRRLSVSPTQRPLTPRLPSSSPVASIAPPPLSIHFSASISSSCRSPPPSVSRTAAVWSELDAAHQRQVDGLLQQSNGSTSSAVSDVLLSQLSLLEMGRAMRVRRIIRRHVRSMQSETHVRLLRRCWDAWMQRVWQRAEETRRADVWRYERQQRDVNERSRQAVKRWRAVVADRRAGELLGEMSVAWLGRRCLHAWHSLLYVQHARLHLALMHRHTLYRERAWTIFSAWQAAAREKRHLKRKEQAVERLIQRRMQARLRSDTAPVEWLRES